MAPSQNKSCLMDIESFMVTSKISNLKLMKFGIKLTWTGAAPSTTLSGQ